MDTGARERERGRRLGVLFLRLEKASVWRHITPPRTEVRCLLLMIVCILWRPGHRFRKGRYALRSYGAAGGSKCLRRETERGGRTAIGVHVLHDTTTILWCGHEWLTFSNPKSRQNIISVDQPKPGARRRSKVFASSSLLHGLV